MTDAEYYQEFLEFKKFKEAQREAPVAKEPSKPKKFIPRRRAKGSGSVYSLGAGRSKPWVASVTIGRDEETGKQIQKLLGYFKTQGEAQTVLSAYELQNKGLIDENSLIKTSDLEKPKSKCPTFKEIWDIVFETEVSKLSNSSKANCKTGFKHLDKLHNMPIDKINLHTIQPLFDDVMKKGAGKSKLNMIKVVCAKVFKYAMKYDYIDKDYSQFITFEATNEKLRDRKPFTKEEIKHLFDLNTFESKLILIFIFTGLRPQELLSIEKKNVHLEESYMIGGLKTENGIDRIIPLHNLIKPFVEEFMKTDCKYLVYEYNEKKAYEEYRSNVFHATMEKLKTKHDPYNTRHTFATLCNECELNEFLAHKIMGHSANDLMKDVYTHVTVERLVNEVNKIKIC